MNQETLFTAQPKEKMQPTYLFGINITPSANGADKAFEIAKISNNLGT
ncbi:MAG TPA: hypothetical protein VJ695_10475 [Nitrososphaera sp.]|nr:hypothetical protein [Nitrososphaera sp.]